MWAYPGEPAAIWTPPPWATPRILFRTTPAPSSTSARKSSKARRFDASWSVSLEDGTNTSRVLPDTPPWTWQATHFACTTGPEMRSRNTASASCGSGSGSGPGPVPVMVPGEADRLAQ